ncbi:MAG: helix-turn-helix domain-containing protein [Verrucomicrobiales bacterium]|nr:helix-turn-helix domain-containing protein [Verrucomicrobiales bacterium]
MSDGNTDPEKVALTPAEFASLFGKSQSWGYRQLYAGKVKALTGYGRVLIPASEVERLLETSGRYLGNDIPPKKVKAGQVPEEVERDPSRRSWKQALRKRRNGNRSKQTENKLNGMNSLRQSALKKLNRSRG